MDKLIELYQVSAIPMETLTRKVHELDVEKTTLRGRLDAPDKIPAKDLFLSAVEDYRDGFGSADLEGRRLLLGSLVERVEIDGLVVRIKWRV